jgi:Flp pilus assembly protein TadD|tara:strand:+ start:40656 stop:41864 length:1209 start_codon:yes stop_codon:yes gene_type:complete
MQASRLLRAGVLAVLAGIVSACGSLGAPSFDLDSLPALILHSGQQLPAAGVVAAPGTDSLLQVTPQMQEFVARYAPRATRDRARLLSLHEAVRGAGALGVGYQPTADGDAARVFASGDANCLSFAHLFVALAREAGLDARYQWLDVRPQWTRVGERLTMRVHVNVMVRMPHGEQFMVDIDPLQARDIAASRLLADREAAALHHNNLAMAALAAGSLPDAWMQVVNALRQSPELPLLWVNLGAIYRQTGQLEAVEWALLQALERDSGERSAMNNLALLYDETGRISERDAWLARIQRYRERNPYYLAWRGDLAGESGDWDEALLQYRKALALQPGDSALLAATGVIHFKLQQYGAAERFLQQAIDAASLSSERREYAAQLERVRQGRRAGGVQASGEAGSTRI